MITAVVPFEMVTVMVVVVVAFAIQVVGFISGGFGSGSIAVIPMTRKATRMKTCITTTERQGESYMNDIATF